MTTQFTPDQMRIALAIHNKLTLLGLDVDLSPAVSVGPLLTVYRFSPKGTTRVNQLEDVASDIAIALHVEDVLIKRMPGESSIGFYIPNAERRWVNFTDIVGSVWNSRGSTNIPLGLGVDHLGNPVVEDLSDLPHLLIAGSTGSGKSTLSSSLLASLVYCCSADDVQLVLCDTKTTEFGHFIGSKHLLFDPSHSIYKALEDMDYLVTEVQRRLVMIGKSGTHNIREYNTLAHVRGTAKLPFIVFVIDELVDLLLNSEKNEDKQKLGKVAENMLATLTARARAAGVHVIASTQRPSVNVVNGVIKANFPARLTFRLPSEADSRTVIGTSGAEHLLSKGDCLYVSPLRAGMQRIHAPYAKLEDIKTAVEVAAMRG